MTSLRGAARPGRRSPGRERNRRWFLAVVVVAAALSSVALATGRAGAAGADGTEPFNQTLHAECPNLIEAYPGSSEYPATAGFYGLPTGFTLSGGTLDIGTIAQTTGVSATACGYFVLPTLDARFTPTSVTTRGASDECPGCSLTFHPGSVLLAGLVSLPTTLVPAGPTLSTVSPVTGPGGGLQLTVSAPVNAVVSVPQVGVHCTIGPINVSLTTALSGSLTGSALTGPLTSSTGKLVGQTFPIPGATPSTDCPADIVPATDGLAGIPAGPGHASFTVNLSGINSLDLP